MRAARGARIRTSDGLATSGAQGSRPIGRHRLPATKSQQEGLATAPDGTTTATGDYDCQLVEKSAADGESGGPSTAETTSASRWRRAAASVLAPLRLVECMYVHT